MKESLRELIGVFGRLGRPAAGLWARPGYFRSEPPAEPPRRLAVVACHWIGDTFWATQVVPALADKLPGCEITAVTKPQTADLWNGLVPAERVIAAPEVTSDRHRERVDLAGLARRAADMRTSGFDVVLDLTGNRYSAMFSFLLRPGWALGFDGGELGWLYSRNVKGADSDIVHLSERPFRVAAPLVGGVHVPERLRPPMPTKGFADVCEELGLEAERAVAVVAPGAGWHAKEWPKGCFVEAVRQLAEAGLQVAAVGSKSEETLCREVAAAGAAGRTVAMAGRALGVVCGLLSGATAVIGNDSGVVHLSAAFGRRTVAVFTGETRPERCGPRGERVTVFNTADGPVTPSSVVGAALSAA